MIENTVSNQDWEKWTKNVYEHITNPDSKAEFNSIDPILLQDTKQITEMLEVLDSISYGGFGDYAIAVRSKINNDVVEKGVVELEVGMGQRNRSVSNPLYLAVWGPNASYIPWPDGSPKFEIGRKGNRVVTLNLSDLSRAMPDSEIK